MTSPEAAPRRKAIEDAFYEAHRLSSRQRDDAVPYLETHEIVEQAFARHGLRIEAEAAAGTALDVDLMREIVQNGVPPDALMVTDQPTMQIGMGGKSLYDWWHLRWAPTLAKVRARLAGESASPEADDRDRRAVPKPSEDEA